jgi:hypothetical protein
MGMGKKGCLLMCSEDSRRVIKNREHAFAELEAIRRDRLRSYVYAEHRDLVDQMLQWAVENKKPRFQTGLIEQQRLFMKIGNYTPFKEKCGS